MKSKYLLLCVFLGYIILPVQSESDMNQMFTFQFHTLSNLQNMEDTSYASELIWEPEIYGYLERSELFFKPSFEFPIEEAGEVYAEIAELKLSFFPSDNISFSAGRYIHDSSFAAFFSQTAFFKTTDYMELLKGSIDSAVVPSWLIEGSLYHGDWYVRGSLEPFRYDLPFFEPDSVWFPNLGFPQEISINFEWAPRDKIELEEIRIVDTDSDGSFNRFIEDIGVALEAGGRISEWDLLILAYSGRNTVPLYTAEIIPGESPLSDDYRVELHPLVERVASMGAAVRRAFGPLVFFGEGSWDFNRPLIKETYLSTGLGFETESYIRQYVGFTLGGRWEWWDANLLVSAEYTNGYILDEEPRTVMPFFQQMALSSLVWSPLDGRIVLSAAGIVAIEDRSLALNFSSEYSPGDGKVSIKLSLPLFFGSPDSSFGAYREILHPTFSSSIRY